MRKGSGFKINLLTKRQKKEQQMARIEEQELRIAEAKAKKQAELDSLEDEDDGFKIRVSKAEYDLL